MPQKSTGIWLKAPEKDGMSLVRKQELKRTGT